MLLSSVVLTLALYGFVGAYFTGSLGFSFVVIGLLWFFNTVVAAYRSAIFDPNVDPSALIVDVNFATPIAFVLGSALGLLYLWALQLVPLLRFELFDVGWPSDSARSAARTPLFVFDTRFTWFALAGVVAGTAGNFLRGAFEPEVGHTVSLVLGVAALVLALGAMLYLLYLWFSSAQPSENLDGVFALALVFLAVTPAVYNYMVLANLRPWSLVVFLLVLLVVVVAFWRWHVYVLHSGNDDERALLLANDVRAHESQASKGRIFTRWATLYLVLLLLYLVGGIVDNATAIVVGTDTYESGNVRTVIVFVFLTALTLAIVGALLGCLRWRRAPWSRYWVWRAEERAGAPLLPQTSGARPAMRTSSAAPARVPRPASTLAPAPASSAWSGSALTALQVAHRKPGRTKRV